MKQPTQIAGLHANAHEVLHKLGVYELVNRFANHPDKHDLSRPGSPVAPAPVDDRLHHFEESVWEHYSFLIHRPLQSHPVGLQISLCEQLERFNVLNEPLTQHSLSLMIFEEDNLVLSEKAMKVDHKDEWEFGRHRWQLETVSLSDSWFESLAILIDAMETTASEATARRRNS